MGEKELRQHRCCFTGHRPEKLQVTEENVKAWLNSQIDNAISQGFVTFITGCAMGVDIWAGQIVVEKRKQNPALHLIAASPYPGFGFRWNEEWRRQYKQLLKDADLIRYVSERYTDDCFMKRNIWMVDHSNLVIAVYNGAAGGTMNTIEYAKQQGIKVIQVISALDGHGGADDRATSF